MCIVGMGIEGLWKRKRRRKKEGR